MRRSASDEDTGFDAAIEALPQWVVTAINLAGVMVLALLQI